jgi:preprotein translocase subunit SecA
MAHEPKTNEPEPEGDYWVDEKNNQVYLSEQGHENAERVLTEKGLLPEGQSLYDPRHISLMHHLMSALRAHSLFHRDQHYVVQDGEVVIVDEFTGRLMVGRRWSDGLHQAVEAKENCKIQLENQTLASITFQNYFRMYEKLAGMTGTADTEAYEFQEIYGLETVIVPTNKPMIRKDMHDQIYKTDQEKYNAILNDIRECQASGQPVLVGTTSVESSELLSNALQQSGLKHEVLNAKQHAREAEIVAQAGKPGAITIATNMAGRGTDIVLGGNVEKQVEMVNADESLDEAARTQKIAELRDGWAALHQQVLDAGGLHIIGTERHESRRIDNQLRGRAGRQGDPGSSRFYLSLDDSLMRIFAGDRVRAIMERLKLPEGEPIEAGMVNRSIESAQRKVEGRNFDIRKQLLEYDDVANDQRRVLYGQRNEVLESDNIQEQVHSLREGALTDLVHEFAPEGSVEEQWDLAALQKVLESDWQLHVPIVQTVENAKEFGDEDIVDLVVKAGQEVYDEKIAKVGEETWRPFERSVMLQVIDNHWREHLAALDHLRQGIHLRGYAQKNPKQEYKREAIQLFSMMLQRVRDDVSKLLLTVKVQGREEVEAAEREAEQAHVQNVQYHHSDYDEALAEPASGQRASSAAAEHAGSTAGGTVRNPYAKVGRNEPCPCGSGKKFKHCHGKLA